MFWGVCLGAITQNLHKIWIITIFIVSLTIVEGLL